MTAENSRILREYIRESLRGGGAKERLAALKEDHWSGDGVEVVVFDAAKLMRFVKGKTKTRSFAEKVLLGARASVVGFGQYGPPPRGKAWGAWEVTRAAGPGYGKIVYGLGYALSPKGLLMPDRSTVSPSAEAAWRKASTTRESLPLDAMPPENRTDTREDDVDSLHDEEGKEFLDRAYRSQGWERTMSDKLFAEGEKTLEALLEEAPEREGLSRRFVEAIFRAGHDLFSSLYNA